MSGDPRPRSITTAWRRLARKVAGFRRRPAFQQVWFLPTWVLLGAGRLAVRIVPFRRLAPHLGVSNGLAVPDCALSPRDAARARDIGTVVALAARYAPWTCRCFEQAIAARLLLGLHRLPSAVVFGLAREGPSAELAAHAWVTSGRVTVVGGEGHTRFTIVGSFVSPRPAAESALGATVSHGDSP